MGGEDVEKSKGEEPVERDRSQFRRALVGVGWVCSSLLVTEAVWSVVTRMLGMAIVTGPTKCCNHEDDGHTLGLEEALIGRSTNGLV